MMMVLTLATLLYGSGSGLRERVTMEVMEVLARHLDRISAPMNPVEPARITFMRVGGMATRSLLFREDLGGMLDAGRNIHNESLPNF